MHTSQIEVLETRIAPASITGNVLNYVEPDGDEVDITFTTKAQLTLANFTFDTATGPQLLQTVNLSSVAGVEGTSIIMKVTKVGAGNGRADVGFIDAEGIDLGKVTLLGDLGRIVAGDDDATPALKSLTVYSLGVAGLASQGGTGSLTSTLTGSMGPVKVTTDIVDATINLPLVAGRGTKMKSLFVGGDLRGGDENNSGSVIVSGSLAKATILGSIEGGSANSTGVLSAGTFASVIIGDPSTAGTRGNTAIGIQGGSGSNSGVVAALNSIKKLEVFGAVIGDGTGSGAITSTQGGIGALTIHGGLIGGAGDRSGSISTELILGKVSIAMNLQGGDGSASGSIDAVGGIGTVTIGQSVIGGSKFTSGSISSQRAISSVRIGDDVIGGAGILSGAVRPDGSLGSINVGGSVTGGAGDQSGVIRSGLIQSVTIATNLTSGTGLRSGMIESDNSIAAVKISGDAIGTAAIPATIVARGAFRPTATSDVALGSVQIGGKAEFLNILAGFDETAPVVTQQIHPGVNGNAQIKSVKISGTAAGVNIVAGVLPGLDGKFGTTDDAPYGDMSDRIDPVIGKLTVVGQWLATAATDDSFVVTADRVIKATINGASLGLSASDDNETVTLSADSKLIEFA